jgi:hypothetical protein
MEAVSDAPLKVAVTTAVWVLATAPAVARKVATMEPAATVTDAGSVNTGVLLESVTTTPPEAATLDSVTIHVEVAPELRLVGAQESEVRVTEEPAGDTVMLAT